MRHMTCCFTGHRNLSTHQMTMVAKRLYEQVDRLVQKGVMYFLSGGALGFDQLAAEMVMAKRDQGMDIRLQFVLPCKNHDRYWTKEQKRYFQMQADRADDIIYISETYHEGCTRKRNHYMVDQSAYCVCAWLYDSSGTGQTVRYAEEQGLEVVNIV